MRRIILLALLALAPACDRIPEPHEREGTWRATGANDANLRAMIADPSHLERGLAPPTPARGEPAARALRQLGTPGAKALPASGMGTPAASQGGGAPTPPGAP